MRSCLVWGMGAFLFAFYYGLCTAKKVTVIKHYDIIVIGSGSAGSNFARMVSRSYKVAVIDKSHLANEDLSRAVDCSRRTLKTVLQDTD